MFFGNPTANINPETGIRYGVTAAQNHPWLYEEIIQSGESLSYKNWKDEILNGLSMIDDVDLSDPEEVESAIQSAIEDYVPSYWLKRHIKGAVEAAMNTNVEGSASSKAYDYLETDIGEAFESYGGEEEYELEKDGAVYFLGYLGGAPLIWVNQSDRIVHVQLLCSPCVPNAGDLDSGLTAEDEGYECYGIPKEWEGTGDE